ncbi:hypothetical protein E4U41_001319 [Claviceps citrina]|nr:hypothetical protein E4U41_001319 [Claviceps citrina]
MALASFSNAALRVAQIAFAAVVLGLTASILHHTPGVGAWHPGAIIYTLVVSSIAILVALISLFPVSDFVHWPVDILLAVMWFVAFGLVLALRQSKAHILSAVVALSFISGVFWLLPPLIGLATRNREGTATGTSKGEVHFLPRWLRRSQA